MANLGKGITDLIRQANAESPAPVSFNVAKKRPYYKDYGIDNKLIDALQSYERYSTIKNFDDDISRVKERMEKSKRYPDIVDAYQRDLNMLVDPNVQKYVNERNAFDTQFNKDVEEYAPIAKEKIINKLLSDGDLYLKEYFNGKGADSDDVYDEINNEFANKYGYEREHYGNMFSPLRLRHSGFYDVKDEEEKMEDGGYRRRYNKDKYIAELLRNGEITLADIKKFFGGK